MISCKEDNPPQLRQVDLDFNEQIKSRFTKLEICSTSANVPESQKRCISIILRSILNYKKGRQCWSLSSQACIPLCTAAHSTSRHKSMSATGDRFCTCLVPQSGGLRKRDTVCPALVCRLLDQQFFLFVDWIWGALHPRESLRLLIGRYRSVPLTDLM